MEVGVEEEGEGGSSGFGRGVRGCVLVAVVLSTRLWKQERVKSGNNPVVRFLRSSPRCYSIQVQLELP